jgi:hypothetical protein
LQVSDGGNLECLSNLIFSPNSKLTVDGGGILDVAGNLTLGSRVDGKFRLPTLEVHPKADGTPYDWDPILYYSGTYWGSFASVTPGITVYHDGEAFYISGTPVPEPATAGLLAGAGFLGLLSRRRRRLSD